jgi:CobQ-like glutamine amidotransferase family enzyme
MLGICGGYQFLGTKYEMVDGTTIDCLGILPFHTVFRPESRMIGDTKYETDFGTVTAFENHSGCTYFDDTDKLRPFGKMVEGFGNNPEEGVEGVRYKNTFGSYSHGPLLRNLNVAKAFADMIEARHEQRLNVAVPA